jgi:hypothetical protein
VTTNTVMRDRAHCRRSLHIFRGLPTSEFTLCGPPQPNELMPNSRPRRPQSPGLWIFGTRRQTYTSAARLRQHRRAPHNAHIGHKIATLKVKSNVHQSDECRNLDQWPNHCRERCSRIDSKDRHRHRNRKFKIVAGSSEGQGRRLGVIGSQLAPHIKRDKEHQDKVNQPVAGGQCSCL